MLMLKSDGPERHPDDQRSTAGMWAEETNDRVVWVMGVKGYGVVILGAQYGAENTLQFKGVSAFTDAEIGWRGR